MRETLLTAIQTRRSALLLSDTWRYDADKRQMYQAWGRLGKRKHWLKNHAINQELFRELSLLERDYTALEIYDTKGADEAVMFKLAWGGK